MTLEKAGEKLFATCIIFTRMLFYKQTMSSTYNLHEHKSQKNWPNLVIILYISVGKRSLKGKGNKCWLKTWQLWLF